ncbi:MAG: hypothetical protein ACYC6L_07775 [Anaerolineae bacterium]
MSENNTRGARNQRVGRAGEYYVVAELNKRGAFAVPFAGNMPKVDVIACTNDESRTIYLQVKTKRCGKTWQTSIVGSQPMSPVTDEHNFWAFVDLGGVDEHPRYWIVPDWWIRDNIYNTHQAYLERHGGRRAHSPDSPHHAIDEKRLNQWIEHWEILRIFE